MAQSAERSGSPRSSSPDASYGCFDENKFDEDFPPGVVDAFPCP
jgi:hypothetical protein